MNLLPSNWRGISVMVCLCLALLTGCDVLGYKSTSQMGAQGKQHSGRVLNTASKQHLSDDGYHQDAADNTAASNGNAAGNGNAAVKVGEKNRTAAGNAKGVDCERYMAGQTYYLQSPDGKGKVVRVKVGASGYGAPPKNYRPEGQRRLMTIRASKIDAYRALAEVVGGLHIWGGSAIGDMVIEHDRYHTFIDTYVRGARVVSVTPMQDGTYRSDVEMDVDQAFLSRVMAFTDPAVDRRCLDQFVSSSKSSTPVYFGANGVAPNFYFSQ